jgi:hemoglobin
MRRGRVLFWIGACFAAPAWAEPTLVPYYTPTPTPNAPYAAWPTPVLESPDAPTPTYTPTVTETPTPTTTPVPPIIVRIGGTVVLENVARTFIKLLRESPRIGYYFAEVTGYKTREIEFVRHFTALLCELAEGDCEYEGRTMKQAHRGMDISAKHVRIFLKVLAAAFEKEGVNREVAQELIERVRLLEADVIDTTPKKKVKSAPPAKPAVRGK